jgi:hypothetical protein
LNIGWCARGPETTFFDESRSSPELRLWTEGKGHTGEKNAWFALNAAYELLDHNRELYPTRAGSFRTASLLTGELALMKGRVTDGLVNYAMAC